MISLLGFDRKHGNGMILSTADIFDNKRFRKYIEHHRIGFFDFGCSDGLITAQIQSHTNTVGIGFDSNHKKISIAYENGLICSCCNIYDIPNEKLVSFTTVFHMLEHLGSFNEARKILTKAFNISTDCVFIKLPFFDSDASLFHCGLKTFYSDWTGHKNHIVTPDLYHFLRKLKNDQIICDFVIGYKGLIVSSDSDQIHPLTSPCDSHKYNDSIHPPKRYGIRFHFPLYSELQALILLRQRNEITNPFLFSPDHIAYDSRLSDGIYDKNFDEKYQKISNLDSYKARIKEVGKILINRFL